ncbi:MAG TPA: glycosyltransferase family 9 protein [Holophagaceae bacterium]|nr:glycosyltransferase family 9 protein [Holophagaceae bacterium]
MHLVLLRLSAIGDILRVLPAWMNLREAFPEARIQAVVEDRHASLLAPFPGFEPVLVKRRALSNPFTAWGELGRVARQLEGAEASLDFHGILKSALIPWRAGLGERWGDGVTKEGAHRFQTHRLDWKYQSRYRQALDLAEAFGRSRGVAGLGTFRPVLKEAPLPDCGTAWWEDGRPRMVLVPGASRPGRIKRWPLKHWVALAKELRGKWQLRWSLGPDEADLREWLPTASGVPALPPMGWWQLAAAVRQADHVLTPDTGLLHLAVLAGVPVTALFGPSDPVIAGIPEGAGRVLRTGIACSPCRERACQRRQCMTEIPLEAVLGALGRP